MPIHAERRGLDGVLIEVRQDLLTHEGGQALMAKHLAAAMTEALAE